MEPTQELIDDIYRVRVMRARKMSPGDKLLAGCSLFDLACNITKSGIRHQHPDADEQQVKQILRERLALKRKLESHACTLT